MFRTVANAVSVSVDPNEGLKVLRSGRELQHISYSRRTVRRTVYARDGLVTEATVMAELIATTIIAAAVAKILLETFNATS
jgi:hypothetical protein